MSKKKPFWITNIHPITGFRITNNEYYGRKKTYNKQYYKERKRQATN